MSNEDWKLNIHPSAIIDPAADVHETAVVGPYAVIDAGVTLGPDCTLAPHVHLTGQTTIGKGNQFHTGAVIGDAPQDVKYNGEPTRLRIGDDNIFREHVTIHRSNKPDEDTVIGSHNFFMANSHVGHNSLIGDHNIFANGALIGGHVQIADRAFLSGNSLVHQFVRIGTLALMQGGAAVSMDVPPYTIAAGKNELYGLNTIGLRRAGMSPGDRQELKSIYQRIFRGKETVTNALNELRAKVKGEPAKQLLEFIAASDRGVCGHASRRAVRD